jgi:hypothetical protein
MVSLVPGLMRLMVPLPLHTAQLPLRGGGVSLGV